ncbi:ABC transporter permease [Roseovarius gahaiensis]|uniref:Transport permease protein n=1 Tax=Roseovarius gahaiensis TaxID=2716691 RepID=A0A967BFV1_9RHOB|nr:ABC transporter permease [Roseovarius gahaiensis]NHQ75674.1 ABC transporter permease [Roseovarius gahaiensis]
MLSRDTSDTSELRNVQRQVPRFASVRSISALILREMTTTYGRSPGGIIWAILEPAGAIALLVTIFSIGFRSPQLGTNFAIYYASGMLPFMMFVSTSGKVQQAINYSRQLLNYPRVSFMDALLARLLLNVLIQAIISTIILTFILVTWDTRTVFVVGRVLNAYAMAIALGFGVGMLNCVLISRNPVWASVWSVATRPLVLISGVIFLHDRIPDPYRTWLEWNPLVHVVGEARRGFYYSYTADYVSISYTYGFAGVCAVLGLLFLKTYYRDLLER